MAERDIETLTKSVRDLIARYDNIRDTPWREEDYIQLKPGKYLLDKLYDGKTTDDDAFDGYASPDEDEEDDEDEDYDEDGDVDMMNADEDDDDCPEDGSLSSRDEHFLKSLAKVISDLHGPMPKDFPDLCDDLAIAPTEHQRTACGKIIRASANLLRAIIIADPPGPEKTLPAMLAIVAARAKAKRFSIVVVPSSRLTQWKEDFEKFFKPGSVDVFVLRDATIPPCDLCKHDVILTTYAFVTHQLRKKWKAEREFRAYREDPAHSKVPRRIDMSVLSPVLDDGVLGEYLIMDGADAVKNTGTATHKALMILRKRFKTAVMLTESPVDNAWRDMYGFLQFAENHDVRTFQKFLNIFEHKDVNNETGKVTHVQPSTTDAGMSNFSQMCDAIVVRRPASTVSLP